MGHTGLTRSRGCDGWKVRLSLLRTIIPSYVPKAGSSSSASHKIYYRVKRSVTKRNKGRTVLNRKPPRKRLGGKEWHQCLNDTGTPYKTGMSESRLPTYFQYGSHSHAFFEIRVLAP